MLDGLHKDAKKKIGKNIFAFLLELLLENSNTYSMSRLHKCVDIFTEKNIQNCSTWYFKL